MRVITTLCATSLRHFYVLQTAIDLSVSEISSVTFLFIQMIEMLILKVLSKKNVLPLIACYSLLALNMPRSTFWEKNYDYRIFEFILC